MHSLKYSLADVERESSKAKFKAISLFAGVGGGCLGIKLAGGKVLAINEFIPEAQDAYQKNFPNTKIFKEDIRELSGDALLAPFNLRPYELDLLVGSPPCSSFSSAGLREKGWGKEKSYSSSKQRTEDLFYEFARLVKQVKPRFFIAENVKGLTEGAASSLLGSEQLDMFGAHEETFYHVLANCGYNIRYKVLDSKDFGIPQSRQRLFIVGVRRDIDFTYQFPHPTTREFTPLKVAFEGIENTDEQLLDADISRYAIYEEAKKLAPNTKSEKYFSLVKQSPDRYSDCLTQTASCLSAASIVHWDNRKFTTPEAIRIMGFPDDIYLGEKYEHQIERLGRAITPYVYTKLIENLPL